MARAFTPRTVAEAVRILADRELGAIPVAGCTDVMVALHADRLVRPAASGGPGPAAADAPAPAAFVDLMAIEELRGVRLGAPGVVDIGATSTFAELERAPVVRAHLPLLAEAAAAIGGWQIRNRATIGGNIATASPAGDALPVLLALDAEVAIAGPAGARTLPFAAMHVGYRQTALQSGELIVRVRVPAQAPDAVHRFCKVGTRAAQAVSKVVVAGVARRDGADGRGGRFAAVRFAAGSVAPTPVRLRAVEELCIGARLGSDDDARADRLDLAGRAARAARAAVSPIDDVRSSAAYRRFVLGRIVRRMVLDMSR